MSEHERGPGRLGMPVEVARQRLLEDAETRKIAETLGMELEAYVERVLYYAQHREAEPELTVLEDEDGQPPEGVASVEEVEAWLEGVASGELVVERAPAEESDAFSVTEEASERLQRAAGAQVERTAPRVETLRGEVKAPAGEAGAALKAQLLAQRQQTRLGLEAKKSKKKG